jgi:hypothetical protein
MGYVENVINLVLGGSGVKCQPCNAKRFKENFKNWTSGNKDIDELIQYSQLNAVHRDGESSKWSDSESTLEPSVGFILEPNRATRTERVSS